jgi:hypothetical protein
VAAQPEVGQVLLELDRAVVEGRPQVAEAGGELLGDLGVGTVLLAAPDGTPRPA